MLPARYDDDDDDPNYCIIESARILRRVLENCCQSNFRERPSANFHVKNSHGVMIILTKIFLQDTLLNTNDLQKVIWNQTFLTVTILFKDYRLFPYIYVMSSNLNYVQILQFENEEKIGRKSLYVTSKGMNHY